MKDFSLCCINVHGHVVSHIVFNNQKINTFKYHVFAPMGRFQLELFTFILHRRPININILDGTTMENKGK